MNTTIAAIATAQGTGGIAIIRISGPESLQVMRRVFSRRGDYTPNMLYYGYVRDENGEKIDEAMGVFMKGPRSYTAEDVCEIHCHGGSVAAGRALEAVLRAGASPAAPGEFTRRAFINGRIDLSQAEAVMQLISARSEAAARSSVRQLTGGVSAGIRKIMDELTGVMALIEASDDFPEELDEETAAGDARAQIIGISGKLKAMCDPRAAHMVMGGASVVLAGRPNVGKSSIMNALLGSERAIVTDIPGTTRDVLTERMSINGVAVELTDTAGRRRAADRVEQIGVERAEMAAKNADLLIIVLDGTEELAKEDIELLKNAGSGCAACVNKQDIGGKVDAELIYRDYNIETVEVSAATGEGMDALRALIARRLSPGEPPLVAQRHIDAAGRAADALDGAVNAMDMGLPLDVCAVDISAALDCLGEITGENARESVIDRVFKDFCVGK